jgi:malonyl CoA-acyl carrier protein transacylase
MRVLEARIPLEGNVSYALGHSLGEFAALKTSGILTFEDSVKLVRLRGEVMAKAVVDYGKETAMYALVVEKGRSRVLIDEIEQFADDFANEDDVVAVANHNSVSSKYKWESNCSHVRWLFLGQETDCLNVWDI